MVPTNKDNLEERFDAGEDVLDYFDTTRIIKPNASSQDVTGHPAFGMHKGETTPVDKVVRKQREGCKFP
jgi:hypothetical protein